MGVLSALCCASSEEKPLQQHPARGISSTARNIRPVKSNASKTAAALSKAVSAEPRPIEEISYDEDKSTKYKVRVLNTELDNSTNDSETPGKSSEASAPSPPVSHPVDTTQVLTSVSNTPQQVLDPYDNEFADLDLVSAQPGQIMTATGFLLDVPEPKFAGKKCLVLDLDETLVHSSFKYLRQADFVIPVEIDNQVHNVYVIKRPGVDEFIRRVGELYEVVVFTASVARYGDPLLDRLDCDKNIHHRLFRESCYTYQGNYIKNLSQVGRDLKDTIIIDNSPASYIFHPQHSVPISSWFSDTHDNELLDILPFLEDLAEAKVEDVSLVLDVTI